MKRLILGFLMLIVFASLSFHGFPGPICSRAYSDTPLQSSKFPAPFQKAKEIAMKVNPNQDGDYVWIAKINQNGEEIQYKIILGRHQESHEHVILGKFKGGIIFAVAYCKDCDIFHALQYPPMSDWIKIDRNQTIEMAFAFFRELVANGLI